jgi:toxin ParE1/3/4
VRGYRLSGEADRDIEEIARFTTERWGWRRAEAYLLELHDALETLVAFPELGRRVDHIRVGYRRLERGSHAIYYVVSADTVRIVRVLHGRMRAEGRL